MPIDPADGKSRPVNAAQQQGASVDIDFDLIERRKSVRMIPCPEATEHNDEASWSTWNTLVAEQTAQSAKEAAMAKLHSLLRGEN